MRRVVAMIMAGGRGKRMDILCYDRPKPALPFAGRFRVIDFSLSNCIHSLISDVAVLTDYQRSSMANYLRRWGSANADHGNLQILEPEDGSYKGTADAVYQNIEYLQEKKADAVLILAGDHVYKMDYRQMLAFHDKMKADVTVGVVPVPIGQGNRFGIVTVDSERRIIDFVEKPKAPQGNLASMGIYVFDAGVLSERLAEDATQPNSPHDFGHAILPTLINRDRIFAYIFKGYWQDIGTVEAYYEANMELVTRRPSFSLDGTNPVLTERDRWPPLRKSEQGTIENSLVSPGCMIKGRVENSIISPGVWVDELAVVRNSIVMANTFVGYHSVLESCILDEEVNVGRFCYAGFGAVRAGKAEHTVLGKGVTVPPYTAISRGCMIVPHAGADEFSTMVVSPGTVVSPSVPIASGSLSCCVK